MCFDWFANFPIASSAALSERATGLTLWRSGYSLPVKRWSRTIATSKRQDKFPGMREPILYATRSMSIWSRIFMPHDRTLATYGFPILLIHLRNQQFCRRMILTVFNRAVDNPHHPTISYFAISVRNLRHPR